MSFLLRVLFIPAAVYASVIIGGGYGTGREVVQYFSRHGSGGGLIALATTVLCFFVVMFLSFEFGRLRREYDYRSFFQHLIGRAWWLYEGLFLALMILVIGVVVSAASEMLWAQFAVPASAGAATVFAGMLVSVLVGRKYLELLMGVWLAGMYLLFIAYFYFVFDNAATAAIPSAINPSDVTSAESFAPASSDSASLVLNALKSGALYAFYNLSVVPVLLYAIRGLKSTTETALCAAFTALVVTLPALLLHSSFMLAPPELLEQSIPVYWMIERYAPTLFLSIFVVVLLGTLIQTGAGLIQGFVERIEAALAVKDDGGQGLSVTQRTVLIIGVLTVSAAFSFLGIVALIGKGYSLLAVGFGLVYVLPLLLRGVQYFWVGEGKDLSSQQTGT